MKTKKITSIILITTILLTFASCTNSTTNEVKETTNVSTTISTESISKDETSTPEEVTTEEPTTQETLEIIQTWKFDISEAFEEEIFIFDYKEDVKAIFDDREFHTGDIINCREEINKLGYDLNEYGKLFSFFYMRIAINSEFEILEEEKNFLFYPTINETQNLVYKNNNEKTIKIDITYDDTSITMTVSFLK